MLRKATEKDIARIAEIIVFTKRTTYRDVFKNDEVSFNVIQVLSEAENIKKAHALDNIYVYDDGIVKGMIYAFFNESEIELNEFYVDPFFQREGIGSYILNSLIAKAKELAKPIELWVLEENAYARAYYEKFGFKYMNIRKEFETTGHYILRYRLDV